MVSITRRTGVSSSSVYRTAAVETASKMLFDGNGGRLAGAGLPHE